MTRPAGSGWLLSIVLTAVLTAGWRLLSPETLDAYAGAVLGLFLLAVCLPLSWRAGLLVLVGAGVFEIALSRVTAAKIAITQAPLTALDFEIAFANPRGLWLALGWPLWSRYLLVLGFPAMVGVWAGLVARAGLRDLPIRGAPGRRRALGSLAAALAGLAWYVVALPGALASHANANDELWEAAALGAYAQRIGPVPFLLYSYHLERLNTGPFYADAGATPLSQTAVHDAATRMISTSGPPRLLPNIVVVFAESTFNPNWAFTLARPVRSALFSRQRDTHALSGLYVNTIGGGSWITEFESIVGVDSRLFGYSGYYTHSTLSPFVRRSLATYLRDKGYETSAYYSWAGDFYNARRAYANYGFDRFFDVGDLGLREFEGSDLDIARNAVARMGTTAARPSFGYIVLYENHAPHRCEHFADTSQFDAVFAKPTGFDQNCELNEYLRRMASTARAIEAVDAHLKTEEHATGRPYVLVVFGDHQPHTFTSTKAPPLSNFDYVSQRTPASTRETFLHIRSSAPSPLRCCGTEAPPAFLLPTLVSAYAADGVNDLYLPQNLDVFQRCGSEILRGVQTAAGEGQPGPAIVRHPDCLGAYRRWLASIQAAGVF
jgi:hypothetical protein